MSRTVKGPLLSSGQHCVVRGSPPPLPEQLPAVGKVQFFDAVASQSSSVERIPRLGTGPSDGTRGLSSPSFSLLTLLPSSEYAVLLGQ